MELGLAISGAKAAYEALSLAVKAREQSKIDEATQALSDRLAAMSEIAFRFIERDLQLATANAALIAANAELHQAKIALENQLRERESYALHEARPGAFVYAPKPELQRHERPPHYLCQPCYDKGFKAILRYSQGNEWTMGSWLCPEQQSHSIEDTQSTRP